MRSNLELRHRGTALADPHVLTVELISRGRKDIPNDAYNDRQPLEIDVGARIVEVLQVTSSPPNLPTPKISNEGTLLKVGPSLIGRRHDITINVLTDGGEPSLTCRSPLVDVQVRQRTGERLTAPSWAPWVAAVVAAVAAVAGDVASAEKAPKAVVVAALTASLLAAGVVLLLVVPAAEEWAVARRPRRRSHLGHGGDSDDR